MTIKKHIHVFHEGNKDHRCNFCDKSFTSFMSFSGHMSAFHEGNEAKMCELCGKSFNHPNNLKRHIHTVHQGHKDYKCDFCSESFAHSLSLKRHVASFHNGRQKISRNIRRIRTKNTAAEANKMQEENTEIINNQTIITESHGDSVIALEENKSVNDLEKNLK